MELNWMLLSWLPGSDVPGSITSFPLVMLLCSEPKKMTESGRFKESKDLRSCQIWCLRGLWNSVYLGPFSLSSLTSSCFDWAISCRSLESLYMTTKFFSINRISKSSLPSPKCLFFLTAYFPVFMNSCHFFLGIFSPNKYVFPSILV